MIEVPDLTHLEKAAAEELAISPTDIAVEYTGRDLSDPLTVALAIQSLHITHERRTALLTELCDTHRDMRWGSFLECMEESDLEVVASSTFTTKDGRPQHVMHLVVPDTKVLITASSWQLGDEYLNSVCFSGYMDVGNDVDEQRRRYRALLDLKCSINPVGPVDGTVFGFSVEALDGLFLTLNQLKRANLDFVDWSQFIDPRFVDKPDSEAGRQEAALVAQYPDWVREFTGK